MRKKYWLVLGVFTFMYLLFIQYNKAYSIANDSLFIEKEILKLLNEPKPTAESITIQQCVDIDNKKYVLYTFNDSIGEAELVKGINNHYRILYTSFDKGMLLYRVQNTSKGNYFVIDGKNQDKLITSAKIIIDGKEYTIQIPEQEFFMAYCSVPKDIQNRFPGSDGLKLLDKSGSDITLQVYKKFQDSKPKQENTPK